VYILRCKDNSYYTGITSNLERRLREHNAGVRSSIQNSKRPARLIYWEKHDSRRLAAKREREIKGWRREKKEKLINSLH
jgi:putative endonuclease